MLFKCGKSWTMVLHQPTPKCTWLLPVHTHQIASCVGSASKYVMNKVSKLIIFICRFQYSLLSILTFAYSRCPYDLLFHFFHFTAWITSSYSTYSLRLCDKPIPIATIVFDHSVCMFSIQNSRLQLLYIHIIRSQYRSISLNIPFVLFCFCFHLNNCIRYVTFQLSRHSWAKEFWIVPKKKKIAIEQQWISTQKNKIIISVLNLHRHGLEIGAPNRKYIINKSNSNVILFYFYKLNFFIFSLRWISRIHRGADRCKSWCSQTRTRCDAKYFRAEWDLLRILNQIGPYSSAKQRCSSPLCLTSVIQIQIQIIEIKLNCQISWIMLFKSKSSNWINSYSYLK